ncbi:MAG: DUF4330 domain-containing protein [Clostridia bacterium]|nr:DUF4330 domain-containing protein [Clostridia bacterium]
MQEKKKAKFNVIDAIVIIAIAAVVAVVAIKLVGGTFGSGGESTYTLKFLCEEVPDFAANVIEVGDTVLDESKDVPLGEVTDVTVSDSRTYTTDSDGNVHLAPKEYYNCVELTTTLTASDYTNGIIVNSSKYGVGHSITIRVGKAKIFGRISAIEKVE